MTIAKYEEGDVPYTFVGEPHSPFGFPTIDLLRPMARFWSDGVVAPPHYKASVDLLHVECLPTPSEILFSLPAGDTVSAQSRRSLAKLHAYFLLVEDRYSRFETKPVVTLAHQASLVRHVLDTPDLKRVLIADEVGLGKTIEAGLIVQGLLHENPSLRILYLAPARLVPNVFHEFGRLGLYFRQYAVQGDANLNDNKIIASIHRAIHFSNFDQFVETDPWDVIIVDECHHLSAWSPGGGDPTRKFALVRELIAKMPSSGRVILLSGTPHQGHAERFDNLLGLLCGPGETKENSRGRVIYRTKDDIRDWEGHPLFPRRKIKQPIVVDLGDDYEHWLEEIREFYTSTSVSSGKAKARAAGWRCAQALQWASSSVHAGLGYLSRQAIRIGWNLSEGSLRRALESLRPYRMGTSDEQVESIFRCMTKEIAFPPEMNEDLEEWEDDTRWIPDVAKLKKLLERGVELIKSDVTSQKWRAVLERTLAGDGDGKVVIFAQPIETVTAFTEFLYRERKQRPALVIGGQSDEDRNNQIKAFREPTGPQFLISSRAGGEGINLQVSHRLIHLDVPWNPMDMEQRVGRVHRFGSRRTIIVDTIVAKNSREMRMYEAARSKLKLIASAMGSEERFEELFSRVMNLIPPQEIQSAILESFPSFETGQAKIAELVQEGFNAWQTFHQNYSAAQKQLKELDPGQANWSDMLHFLCNYLDGECIKDFITYQFRWNEERNEIQDVERNVSVVELKDNQFYLCEDHYGMPIIGPKQQEAKPIGINTPIVAEMLRKTAFPSLPSGAAWLRWDPENAPQESIFQKECGVLIFLKQTIHADNQRVWSEQSSQIKAWVVSPDSEPVEYQGIGLLVRALCKAKIRRHADHQHLLIPRLIQCEKEITAKLRALTFEERQQRFRNVCTPIFAGLISPASGIFSLTQSTPIALGA